MGSIAAGGRYDGLVGMFSAAAAAEGKKAPASVPCVGMSIGMDRMFALIWPKWVERGMRSKATMAYVMAAGDGLLEERVGLVRELREAGIKVRSFQIAVYFFGRWSDCCIRRTSWQRQSQSLPPNLRQGRRMKCRLRLY